MTELPIVVLPVGTDDDALDACLAALEAATPAGTRVWLADDAQAGPRGYAIIEHWLGRTALKADYTRRQRSIGEVAHLDEVLHACGYRIEDAFFRYGKRSGGSAAARLGNLAMRALTTVLPFAAGNMVIVARRA